MATIPISLLTFFAAVYGRNTSRTFLLLGPSAIEQVWRALDETQGKVVSEREKVE